MIIHGVYGTEFINEDVIFDGKVIRHKCAICGSTFYNPFGLGIDICCSKECEKILSKICIFKVRPEAI